MQQANAYYGFTKTKNLPCFTTEKTPILITKQNKLKSFSLQQNHPKIFMSNEQVIIIVVSEGFQPSTYGVGDHCSMQLS